MKKRRENTDSQRNSLLYFVFSEKDGREDAADFSTKVYGGKSKQT